LPGLPLHSCMSVDEQSSDLIKYEYSENEYQEEHAAMQDRAVSSIDSLAGTFLISTPQMPDPRFEEHVIYVCAHSSEGAVAINRPNGMFTLPEILQGANLPVPDKDFPPVYMGGPVEMESAFILFKSGYEVEHKLDVSDTISLTREAKVLEDIANGRGPEQYLFILGYTGWGPGQLDNELVANGWLTVPADDKIIFSIDDKLKWRAAALQFGIDIAVYEDVIGNA